MTARGAVAALVACAVTACAAGKSRTPPAPANSNAEARFTTTTAAGGGATSTSGPTSSLTTGGGPTSRPTVGRTVPTTAPTPTGSPPPAVAGLWPTYHRTNDRNGSAALPRPGSLSMAWTATLDGAVYGQPLVSGDRVMAATENNTVYALDLATGHERWRTHLGTPVAGSALPCGNIDPLGITGTPAYDPGTDTVFAATETGGGVHDLLALNATTGAIRFTRNLDVGGHDRGAQQERGALAIANGRVYVPFGGLYGDCGDYIGYIAAVPVSGTGSTVHYDVPATREAGIWAPPGPAIGPDGTVYAAVGNGAATSGAYDGSDSIVRLTADLSARIDFFAPTAWASQNASDLDLGSTGPIVVAGGLVLAAGKGGSVYLLNASHLGGIGGQITSATGCTGFGGMAADGQAVFVPCLEGLQRFDVTANSLRAGWRAPVTGSPVVGGGVVWSLDTSAGVLHTFDEQTGAALASITVAKVTRFSSPAVVPRFALVATTSGIVAVHTR